jgi:hypothetical protein
MRNSLRQFLRLQLDRKAEVWSALVGGQPVKPARDGANGDVLIPLAKSADVNRRLSAFSVELIYAEHASPAPRWRGELAFTAPATDILSSATTWTILTPVSRWVYAAGGDLTLAEGEQLSLRDLLPSQSRRAASGARHETIHRLKEGIERFLITDINNPASSGAVKGPPRYTGQPVAPDQAGAAPTTASVAGVLPVAISLPTSGVAHSFTRILVPQGTVLNLVLHTYPGWLRQALSLLAASLIVALGFAAGMAGARVARALARDGKLAGYPACGLAVCGASLVVANRVYEAELVLAYWSALAGVVITMAPGARNFARSLFTKPVARETSAAKDVVS